MIKNSQIWLGSFPEAYEDDIQNWIRDNSQNEEEVHVINCGENNFEMTQLSDPLFDESLGNAFNSSSLFFGGGKTILLKNAQEWDQQFEVSEGRGKRKQTYHIWQLIDALNILEQIDEEINIGIAFFTGADPNEEVLKFMINGTDDINDYSVFYSDHNELASWIQMWLNIRGYEMSTKEAFKVAEHLGIEINILPVLVSALRSYTQMNDPDRPVKYSDLRNNLGSLGMNEIWKITSAIEAGDQISVLDMCHRLEDGGVRAQLGSLNMVMSKIQNYIRCLDDENYSPPGMNPKAGFYIRKSAKQLGRQRLLNCMKMGLETERSLKGDMTNIYSSRLSATGPETSNFVVLHLFYSFMAGQFEASSRK